MSDSPVSFLRMTPEEREKSMVDNSPVCSEVHRGGAYFDWQWKGCGFGQFSFHYDLDKGWSCDNEMMGPESTRRLLHAFADHVADNLTPLIVQERKDWEAKSTASE